jgi:nitroreductase
MMNKTFNKGIFFSAILILCTFTWVQAQEQKTIKLTDPAKKGGLSIMESFAKRSSSRSWADKELSSQDLSNLLWAGFGINRPDSKKRTAPSAMNSQDVDIYIIMKRGVYLYDAATHTLNPVASGDHRSEVSSMPKGARPSGGASGTSGSSAPAGAPGSAPGSAPAGSSATSGGGPSGPPGGGAEGQSVQAASLILVSDKAKFSIGNDDTKKELGIIDAALVSENIALFCAGNGLANIPRYGINKDTLKTLLKLKDTQFIVMENAVGYPAETK